MALLLRSYKQQTTCMGSSTGEMWVTIARCYRDMKVQFAGGKGIRNQFFQNSE